MYRGGGTAFGGQDQRSLAGVGCELHGPVNSSGQMFGEGSLAGAGEASEVEDLLLAFPDPVVDSFERLVLLWRPVHDELRF